ncbi:MAG: 50S ribosomal protein L10 [Thermoplasmata archaeon]
MPTSEVAEWKLQKIEELTKEVTESPVVAVADVKGIPSPQLQHIRKRLRGMVKIIVSKKSLIQHSLEKLSENKKGIEQLANHMSGQVAFVLSELNPFMLYKEMESTKTKVPARGGEVSPEDLLVKRGDTPFKPGPIMSELQRAGLPASIEGGKVVIKKDTLLVKKGEKIPRRVAQVLTRLEIYPLTVGLDLTGVYEDGIVFLPDDLWIDESEFRSRLSDVTSRAVNLAMFIHYATDYTIKLLLLQAELRALNLAMNSGIPTKKTIELLLQKAYGEMLSLSSQIPNALDDELKQKLPTTEKREPERRPEKEKKEEEKEVSEEEAASGLGALFG